MEREKTMKTNKIHQILTAILFLSLTVESILEAQITRTRTYDLRITAVKYDTVTGDPMYGNGLAFWDIGRKDGTIRPYQPKSQNDKFRTYFVFDLRAMGIQSVKGQNQSPTRAKRFPPRRAIIIPPPGP